MRINFILLLLLTCSILQAQRIDFENFNEELLEQEILIRMNRHRQARGLPALQLDRILAEAAFDQVVYLDYLGELTHDQRITSKETPQKRVRYFEGSHSPIGENVTYINLEDPNYAAVADRFFSNWQRADADYANIASSEFLYTGIRFSVNMVKQRIYGVQVFGGPMQLDLSGVNALGFLSNPVALKPFDPGECGRALNYDEIAASLPGNIVLSQDSIFLSYPSKAKLEKLLVEEENDGIALDIIKRDQLTCNGGHHFDPALTHDGFLMPLISAEALYSRNENGEEDPLYTFLGTIPENLLNDHVQVNVLTVNNNTVCRNDYFYDIPQGDRPFYRIQPIWAFKEIERAVAPGQMDFLGNTIPGTILSKRENQFIEFPLVYASRAEDTPDGGLDSIRLFTQKNIDWIESIDIQLLCSIDNDAASNRKMLDERAAVIQQMFLRLGIPKAKVNVLAEENWRMFYSQIESTEWAHYSQLPEKDIRQRISNKFTQSKMANFMEAQNKFNIIIKYKQSTNLNYAVYEEVKTSEENKRLIRQMKSYVDKLLVDEALILQFQLIQGFLNEQVNIDDLLEIQIPSEERNLALLSNHLAVELFFRDSISEEPYFIRNLKKIADFDKRYLPMQYNLAAYAVRYMDKTGESIFEEEELADLEKRILDMNYNTYYRATYQDKGLAINRLMTNFHLVSIEYYQNQGDAKLLDRAYQELRDYAAVSKFEEAATLQLARFYNKAQYFDWSINVLKPFFQGSQSSEEVLFLYTQTRALMEGAANEEKFINLLKMLRRKNPKRFCTWMNRSFQLIRSDKVKQVFCESCG